MEEIWEDISGYEGKYKVSNLGRLKSLKRKISKSHKGNRYEEIIMKPLKGDGRYLQISLWNNGKDRKMYIHRLVAIHFIKNESNKPQVNHIDGNRKNNTVSNLEWVTGSENISHSISSGLNSENGKPKLSNSDVISILKLRKEGKTIQYLSEMYGVNNSAIYSLLKRKTYKQVEV